MYIYDVEVDTNFHSCCFLDVNTEKLTTFVISPERNDSLKYFKFLNYLSENQIPLIGFNNVNYDYEILLFLFQKGLLFTNVVDLLKELKNYSDSLIDKSNKRYGNFIIPQIDLYLIHHYDNPNRRASLKHLQHSLKWHNLQDVKFGSNISLKEFIKYNENDVLFTYELYKKSIADIELREELSKKFDIDCINWNAPKIGEEIILKMYCEKNNTSKERLKPLQSRVYSSNEFILPRFKSFNTNEFQTIYNTFKSWDIDPQLKNKFEVKVQYKNVEIVCGKGGIHGCTKKGVYVSDEDYMIVDLDVSSFYPNIAIVNNIYPRHLGKEFYEIYKEIYETRKTIPKSNSLNAVYKLMLNGVYGKSNSIYSKLFDSLYMLKITINGQLYLLELTDKLLELNIEVIQLNTDGGTYRLKRTDYNRFKEIYQQWEKDTSLSLEEARYDKMIIRNVNNYMSLYSNGKIKAKGDTFLFNQEWHQKNADMIIKLALQKYFFEGIDVSDTINNCDDPFMFVRCIKTKHPWTSYINKTKEIEVQKVNRYVISDDGYKLYKKHPDGRVISWEAKHTVEILNKIQPPKKLNKEYYIAEARKIIKEIEL